MAEANRIRYTGAGTHAQLTVFRVTGVLQWLTFYLLSEVYA